MNNQENFFILNITSEARCTKSTIHVILIRIVLHVMAIYFLRNANQRNVFQSVIVLVTRHISCCLFSVGKFCEKLSLCLLDFAVTFLPEYGAVLYFIFQTGGFRSANCTSQIPNHSLVRNLLCKSFIGLALKCFLQLDSVIVSLKISYQCNAQF